MCATSVSGTAYNPRQLLARLRDLVAGEVGRPQGERVLKGATGGIEIVPDVTRVPATARRACPLDVRERQVKVGTAIGELADRLGEFSNCFVQPVSALIYERLAVGARCAYACWEPF